MAKRKRSRRFITLCIVFSSFSFLMCSSESLPLIYKGPQVSVLSSNISSSGFETTLQLSNATTWMNSGQLDINSNNAGVIWALGSTPPSQPSNPASNFQQHNTMGTFSIDMKSAQVSSQSTPSGTSSGPVSSSAPAAPTISGVKSPGQVKIGLTYRDKVSFQKRC
jgi:hypothetical protein